MPADQNAPDRDDHLAPIKEQVYRDSRPIEELQPYYDWALTHKPDAVYTLVRVVTGLYILLAHRVTCIGRGNIPADGPVIFAPNHASNIDHFFLGAYTNRKVQFMAKSQLFSGPLAWIYKHGGVFPVRRGHHDEQSFAVARSILERGGTVCTYCEGGRSRTGLLADRAKPGIGRVTLESGAPVVPVAMLNSHRVRNWKRLRFVKVTVRYGKPLHFDRVDDPTREQQQAVADEIFAAIRGLHDELRIDGVRAVRRAQQPGG